MARDYAKWLYNEAREFIAIVYLEIANVASRISLLTKLAYIAIKCFKKKNRNSIRCSSLKTVDKSHISLQALAATCEHLCTQSPCREQYIIVKYFRGISFIKEHLRRPQTYHNLSKETRGTFANDCVSWP